MNAPEIFQRQVEKLAGRAAANVVPEREVTLADVREEWPTGPDLARALGYGDNRDHPRGSRGWRARRNLLDDYSRWRRGARNPFRAKGGQRSRAVELRRAVMERWTEEATPAGPLEVLQLIDLHGATVTYFRGTFEYEPDRERIINAVVYVAPEVLHRTGYSAEVAAAPPIAWWTTSLNFLEAWGISYGLDDGLTDVFRDPDPDDPEEGVEFEGLVFEIGRAEGVDYDYRE